MKWACICTHYEEYRWSTACSVGGLLAVVGVFLLRINFGLEQCVVIVVFVVVIGAAFVVVVGFISVR